MEDKLLISKLLQGAYICKRHGRDKRFGYAAYTDNMIIVSSITTRQFKQVWPILKERKARFTLNLRSVRSLHGKSIAKQLYKQSKLMKDETH